MFSKQILNAPAGLRAVINEAYRKAELNSITTLIEQAQLTDIQTAAVSTLAARLVEQIRLERKKTSGIDTFLTEYSLSSQEGIALMCLAEALLRVPDKATIDSLIKDKLTSIDWAQHNSQSDSFFINATTWALMLTGKVLAPEKAESTLSKALLGLVKRSGEGVVRASVNKGMQIMSKQFVMGRTIKEALQRAKKNEALGYRYSYDMLGEAALTANDAERYLTAYSQAIEAIGKSARDSGATVYQKPGISVKLSALHPRYQEAQQERVLAELPPKLLSLAQMAKQYNIGLTVDAEESERLDLSLDVIETVFNHDSLSGWNGFGLAIQAYQKRTFYVLDWIAALARGKNRRMMVRLVKGAYWDSEIKKAQMQGQTDYPVFTRKVFTDVSYQACAKKLLSMTDAIYPQFATHNAYSVAMIINIAGDYRDFEFQCLHGMGNELYAKIVPADLYNIPCRIYAPVGSHEDLLPYLVRRLLENGANSSFVNRIVDDKAPISELVEDPVSKARHLLGKINQNIPLPASVILPERKNSPGMDFTDRAFLASLQEHISGLQPFHWEAAPILANRKSANQVKHTVTAPQCSELIIGQVTEANLDDIELALTEADKTFATWSKTSVTERAAILERLACLLEEHMPTFLAIACLEAGKTWNDGVAEVREAIDFCRYYSAQAE